MNKELLFAKTLEEVRSLAKEQGNCVSEEQVIKAFAPLDMNEEQMQMVYDYLLQHKIGIGAPLAYEDYLTEEERDYLQEYLNEVDAIPTCSEGEKTAITISAMAGDIQAQKRLIELYLKDVPEIAALYAGQGVFLEDLIGEGNVALAMGVTMLGSLETPQEAQGMLGKLLMDAMEEYIKENADNKKADQRLVKRINEVAKKASDLAEEMGRKVSVEELSGESGLSEKVIRDAMRMSGYKIDDIVDISTEA